MFEAYKVAVKLSLINNVSSGLVAISQQFMKTGKDVDALHARLDNLRKITLLGAAASGAGIFGLGIIGKALKPAEEYTHQLNIMNMAGMKQAEIADAVGAAWKLAGDNMTTTATGNLKALLDLRNVTGSLSEAREFLPIMQRMQTVLAASKDGHVSGNAGDLAFSAMKALDIRGAVNDPEALKRQADLMTRVIVGTQGRVTPEQFQSVFNYARQAKFSLSDDFAYKYLPTLMLENAGKGGGGGGAKGVGPALAALYRLTNQGFVNKKSIPLLKELGLLGDGSVLPTTTTGTVVAPLKDAGLAASNSFAWTNQTVVPRIMEYLKRHNMEGSDQNVLQILNMISRGNQLAGGVLGEFYVKRKNFERDRGLMEGVMSPENAYKNAMTKDPATAHRALSAAWENFQTSLTVNVVPVVVPALLDLSKALNGIGEFARRHPNVTRDAVLGFGAIAGVLAIGGPLITGLAMTRLAFGDLGGVLGGGKGIGLVAGISKATTAIGSVGMAGTLVGGLGLLGIAVVSLSSLLDTLLPNHKRGDTNKSGQVWQPGVNGRGGNWVSPGKSQESHEGEQFVRSGRGGHWAKTINNTIVLPDKRVLASVVTEVQANEARRPTSGTTRFDGRMSPAPVGTSGRY
jgi:hypothetical protein